MRRRKKMPRRRGLSRKGLALIAKFEGFESCPYYDSAGVRTVGYGHAYWTGGCISERKARRLLRSDVREAEAAVRRYVRVPVTQGQYDALVSFTFNVGGGALRSSTLLEKLNRRHYRGARRELGKWVNAGGQRLQGLVRRRGAEAWHWRTR